MYTTLYTISFRITTDKDSIPAEDLKAALLARIDELKTDGDWYEACEPYLQDDE